MPQSDPDKLVEERLLRRSVLNAGGCRVWAGGRSEGYGRTSFHGKSTYTHRLAFFFKHGRWPTEIDHLCRNRACLEVTHLEEVTSKENTYRGSGFGAINIAKTHCVNGHPLAGDNLRISVGRNGNTRRNCRACHRIYWHRRKNPRCLALRGE